MLIVLDKSMQEEHLSQPLETIIIQFKIVVIFLSGYNGVFNIPNEGKIFNFISVFGEAKCNLIQVPRRAHELESLDAEIKRNIIEEGYL